MPAILVPVDGSVHALKALRIACDLGEKYGGHIVLLHVLVPGRKARRILALPIAERLPADVVSQLQGAKSRVPEATLRMVGDRILKDAARRSRRRGLDTEILPIGAGNPVECILVAARRTRANTIVMGCRGLNDAQARGFGSVSREVFQKASCTCISVK